MFAPPFSRARCTGALCSANVPRRLVPPPPLFRCAERHAGCQPGCRLERNPLQKPVGRYRFAGHAAIRRRALGKRQRRLQPRGSADPHRGGGAQAATAARPTIAPHIAPHIALAITRTPIKLTPYSHRFQARAPRQDPAGSAVTSPWPPWPWPPLSALPPPWVWLPPSAQLWPWLSAISRPFRPQSPTPVPASPLPAPCPWAGSR